MKIRTWATMAALAFCGSALADTEWMCGSVVCETGPYNLSGVATGLHDLVVDGISYDVSFLTSTEISPFLFSDSIAAPGAPATGVDAGNALVSFANTVDPNFTNPNLWGPFPGIGPSLLVTAVSPIKDNGDVNLDLTTMFIGGISPLTTTASSFEDHPDTSVITAFTNAGRECQIALCTQWTLSDATEAPEISLGTAPAAIMLLLGLFAIAQERRRS